MKRFTISVTKDGKQLCAGFLNVAGSDKAATDALIDIEAAANAHTGYRVHINEVTPANVEELPDDCLPMAALGAAGIDALPLDLPTARRTGAAEDSRGDEYEEG